ncbi:unnamed protein product (macronuclear) [Paramecium tetraurelia]|uniref:UBC core domain-containing protein n=1 Tax=Paramecium tetraurelia TaxID=5888 RepID=A0C227_PARTE|nr:uncharacterized protein GSPATT00034321001 [Paramecium tetraurelia]CAK64844.1 unnamed protein product [Paramecium tetraurelia]|eukprot:XP_001432241.1 hypothetical protein (macronuclear) [Paramecium tetraurelia strain d4-2]
MSRRLSKELEQMQKSFANEFNIKLPNNEISHWIVGFEGAKGTLYEGEKFELQFKFPNSYVEPIESPEVVFLGKPPEHEHIYSNGFICLSILYDEWSAAHNVSSLCLSIQSMMSSATIKMKPPNDADFVKQATGRGPKSYKWTFHDTKC